MMIDTHAHTYMIEDENAIDILKECEKQNILVILNGVDKKSNQEVLELSKRFKNVYASIGYEYSNADKYNQKDLVLLEEQIKNNKVVAIGEIGIDYHYTKDNKETQKELFRKQLDLAEKYNLPVIVHSRDAVQDVYDELKNRNLKGSIHCYSGSKEMAKEFVKLGFYIGVDGPITFKNNKKQKNVIKNIDINHILTETDSPYLSPEPKRGQKNSPLNLKYIVKVLAEELNISENEMQKITLENAKRLFDLDI